MVKLPRSILNKPHLHRLHLPAHGRGPRGPKLVLLRLRYFWYKRRAMWEGLAVTNPGYIVFIMPRRSQEAYSNRGVCVCVIMPRAELRRYTVGSLS